MWAPKNAAGKSTASLAVPKIRPHGARATAVHSAIISALVETSWDRCASVHQLSRTRKEGPSVLTTSELKAAAEPLDEFTRVARHEIMVLLERLSPAKYVVVLSDPNGVALDVQSSIPVDKAMNRMGVCAGATWGEPHVGTNGIGTSIACRAPVIVHRQHHFLLKYSDLTCTAAPVFDSHGRVIASLDASSIANLSSEFQSFILELVVAAARRIQQQYFLAQHREHSVISVRPGVERAGASRFMLALGDDGRAIDCLGDEPDGTRPPELAALMGRNFAEVADAKWQDGVVTHEASGATERLGVLRFEGRDTPFFATMRLPRSQGRTYFAPGGPQAVTPTAAPRSPSASAPDRSARTAPDNFIGLDALAGSDPVMRGYVATVRKMADWRLPVLLQGETGTGKEEFARGIHAAGSRAAKPFVAIDCSSIPESLIESELFGYEPGTFTGARRDGRHGRIFEANGGTLFLDEIGDMPLSLQTRLLRVLALNEVTPLGSAKSIPVDFALISASHQQLPQMIAEGRFRQDLYYRIAGVRFLLPALRERQDKTEVILNALAIEAEQAHVTRCRGRSADALGALLACSWPGNMRELRLVLRYALASASGGEISLPHLPSWLEGNIPSGPACANPQMQSHWPAAIVQPAHHDGATLEERLREVLLRHGWCISDAANELAVSRQTMYRWLRKCRIERPVPG